MRTYRAVATHVASTWIALSTCAAAAAADARLDLVLSALDRRDCAAAVDALNEGMARSEPVAFDWAGRLYETGLCLRPNPDIAASLYERGARGGDRSAARSLALLCARGVGRPQSYARAAFWFAIADRSRPDVVAIDDAVDASPALSARAYIEAVHELAAQSIDYPDVAAVQGVHGRVVVRFDASNGTVAVVDSSDNRGSSATSFGPSRHLFERVAIAAYASAIASLARPPIPDGVETVSDRELLFERDRNDREPGRGLARGFAGV